MPGVKRNRSKRAIVTNQESVVKKGRGRGGTKAAAKSKSARNAKKIRNAKVCTTAGCAKGNPPASSRCHTGRRKQANPRQMRKEYRSTVTHMYTENKLQLTVSLDEKNRVLVSEHTRGFTGPPIPSLLTHVNGRAVHFKDINELSVLLSKVGRPVELRFFAADEITEFT